MPYDSIANAAYSILINAPGTAGTAFAITPGTGTNFVAGAPISFRAVGTVLPLEIGRLTAIVGDTLTITRTVETDHGASTVPLPVGIGWEVFQTITRKTLIDMQTAAPAVHAPTHLPNSTDAIDWAGTIHQKGTHAARPAAGLTNAGSLYFETDTGILFRSDGAVWLQIAIGGGATMAVTVIDGGDVAQGTTTDAAWTSGAGTVIALLKKIAAGGGSAVTIADGADVTQGITTGAKVVTDAAGTVQQYLRGLVTLIAAKIGVTIADGDLATLGVTTGAAVITDVNGTAQQYLRGIVKLLGTSGTIVLGAGANAIGKLSANAGVNIGVVGGTTIPASDTFTRPADTTAYAVGDSMGATVSDSGTTALRGITVAGAVGGTGYLTKIRLWTDQAACVAVVRIHFYTVAAPPTAIPGDNVANGLFYANFAKRIGQVDLPALSTETSGNTAAHAQDITTRLPFQCDPADTKLYYRLQTQTVFTPNSGQSWSLELNSERNGT